MTTRKACFLLLAALFVLHCGLARAFGFEPQYDIYGNPVQPWWGMVIDALRGPFVAACSGGFLGILFSHKLRVFRQVVVILALLAAFFYFEVIRDVLAFFVGLVTFLYLLRDKEAGKAREEQAEQRRKNQTFGSAEWATLDHLEQQGCVDNGGLFLGDFEWPGQRRTLAYKGDRHLLTVAPTRSGKGVSSIIPNLLTYRGSALVIDPKGENAKITAERRGAEGLGQAVHVVDPWGITGLEPACFNPLDWLVADDEDISENAMMLADSIVTSYQGTSDSFWNEEAKALLMGILLYVALDPDEQEQRTLGRVRDIIVADDETFKAVLVQMAGNANPIVSSTALRTASKDEKLRSNVLTSLQAHTHFLDSPRIRHNLSRSDFKFEDLKTAATTVYLVLPADRLETFGRWLRLLVQQAITVNARTIGVKPERPILFLLDEMAALGRLTMVEQAYGLMAGFGMQLWGIVQDLSQLERVYDTGWETFIGNSGVLQYFGSRDHKTAEYFSKLCGVSTIEKVSVGNALAHGIGYVSSFASGGNSSSQSSSRNTTFSMNFDVVQRQLAYPDELMVLREGRQILFVENSNPIQGRKTQWFSDARFKTLGRDLDTLPKNIGQPSLALSQESTGTRP